jgi:hypothetical protein
MEKTPLTCNEVSEDCSVCSEWSVAATRLVRLRQYYIWLRSECRDEVSVLLRKLNISESEVGTECDVISHLFT